jgi:hypothetical protein
MDEQTLMLQRGTAAEELLANEAFITCVNALYNEYFADITGSSLEDTQKRETRFFQLRALQDISTELRSWVAHRDSLLSPTEE